MTRARPNNTILPGCPVVGHGKASPSQRCEHHGVFHYRCAVCNADCTMGTEKGPATQGTDGVHRCWECQRAWQHRLASASPSSAEEIATLVVALSEIAISRDELYDEHRERAVMWLDRLDALPTKGLP